MRRAEKLIRHNDIFCRSVNESRKRSNPDAAFKKINNLFLPITPKINQIPASYDK